MIWLTTLDGSRFFIMIDHIVLVGPGVDRGAIVCTDGEDERQDVKETPREIAAMLSRFYESAGETTAPSP